MPVDLLPPCPDSPNCVSSQAEDSAHHVPALSYSGTGEKAFSRLEGIILAFPRTRILKQTDVYIHAEFRTRWLNFKDDVEAILDEKSKTIQIRSASRVGHSDFGTNRRRVESIRKEMNKNEF